MLPFEFPAIDRERGYGESVAEQWQLVVSSAGEASNEKLLVLINSLTL